MNDFFEIDFLDVESINGGDAITARYQINGETFIHIIDGGYIDDGKKIKDHINKYYGNPTHINHVVLTHQDRDHAGGLRTILEDFSVGTLWMHRPWLHAKELIKDFSRYKNVENLSKRLKEIYSNAATLEEIALEKKIEIKEPFQGDSIGCFQVLSPTLKHYYEMILKSDKTPDIKESANCFHNVSSIFKKGVEYIKAFWGQETFPETGTSEENEMSVIQFAELNNKKILLTGDAGRISLDKAYSYSKSIDISLPCIDYFQVPHHGSRHNLNSALLDKWLGKKKNTQTQPSFTAVISASKNDDNHPRNVVVRSLIHRGANVLATKGSNLRLQVNAPYRKDYYPATPLEYPDSEEK